MSWFAINGVDTIAITGVATPPTGDRRDIGDATPAADGSVRVTRQARKRDFKFETVPLIVSDAFAWESLLIGEGEHWSFDAGSPAGFYGSKGLGPSSTAHSSIVTGTPKFGTDVLRLTATSGTITFPGAAKSLAGLTSKWTVSVWRYESSVWHSYIVTSSGHKWLDGTRADGTSTSWLSVSSGDVTIANTAGSAQDYDDVVILPYEILDSWGPTFGTATSAFSDLPFVFASGDNVPEAATRTMVADTISETLLKTSDSESRRKLSVAMKAA